MKYTRGLAFGLLFLVLCILAFFLCRRFSCYTTKDSTSFKGMNTTCPCDPKTLLTSGTTGGLLADRSQFPGSNVIISILNNNNATAYIAITGIIDSGPSQLLKNTTIPPNTLYREGFPHPKIDAGRIYVTYDNKVASKFTALPLAQPLGTEILLLEMTILFDGTNWINDGDISYVDSMGIPALLYFGPNKLRDVDSSDTYDNNKLMYTTCTQDQLLADCPTMVNENNLCIAPGEFCYLTNKGSPNWASVCDDSSGDMGVYIKEFGIDKVDSLYTNPSDLQTKTRSSSMYATSNPYKYVMDKSITNIPDVAHDMGQYYWPTPDKVTAGATSYSWTDDEEKRLYTGKVDDKGQLIGAPSTTLPTPPGTRIKAYNSTLNGEAITLGLCNPDDVTNDCAYAGDYMARYTQPVTDTNNYTKNDQNITNDISNWFSGKYPYNRYAKHVVERTHLVYGFPYQELRYGGNSTSLQTELPQMMVILYPTCTSIETMVKNSKPMPTK